MSKFSFGQKGVGYNGMILGISVTLAGNKQPFLSVASVFSWRYLSALVLSQKAYWKSFLEYSEDICYIWLLARKIPLKSVREKVHPAGSKQYDFNFLTSFFNTFLHLKPDSLDCLLRYSTLGTALLIFVPLCPARYHSYKTLLRLTDCNNWSLSNMMIL